MARISEQEFLNWLLAIAANTEPESVRDFLSRLVAVRDAIPDDVLEQAIRTANVAAVEQALRAAEAAAAGAASAEAIGSRILEVVGPAAADRLADTLGVEAVEWEDFAHRARLWLRQHGAELVTNVGEPTRQAIREAIEGVFARPMPAQRAVPALRNIVGMNVPQGRAYTRFYRDLYAAVDDGTITERRALELARRYRDRLIKHRAITVARAETMAAANAAQRELWRATDGQIFDAGTYVREAIGILRDGRICAVCHGRHGWRAPIGKPYPDGSDGPPWGHPGCRCQERLVRPDDPQPSTPPFVEPERGGGLRPLIAPR